MMDSQNIMSLMITNTIGLSVLYEVLREAYSYLSANQPRTIDKQAFMFVQGTGLEKLLVYYHMDYDAENIRQCLYTMAKRKDLIE